MQNIFGAKNFNIEDSHFVQILMLRYKLSINYPKINYLIDYSIFLLARLLSYPKTIVWAFYRKDIRRELLKKLKDKSWYIHHVKTYKNPNF
jgi:hypothetical protein